MADLVFLLAFYLLYGLIYNVVMVIILAAGLITASMKKQYVGYFIVAAIIQGTATFGNFEPILSGEADYIQLGCNLFWSILLFLFFWKKARELYSRDK